MKLIYIPLGFLIFIAFLSTLGLGSHLTGAGSFRYLSGDPAGTGGYFDVDGHQVASANGSAVGEAGLIQHIDSGSGNTGPWEMGIVWKNNTWPYQWNVYDGNGDRVVQQEVEQEFNIFTDSFGMLTIVGVGVIAGGIGVVAITFLGGSDTGASAILKGTLYYAIWGVFSVLGMDLMARASYFGPLLYTVLTVVYTLGVINQTGHPEDV